VGSVTLDGQELLGLPTWAAGPRPACSSLRKTRRRSRGVRLVDVLAEVETSTRARPAAPEELRRRLEAEGAKIGVPAEMAERASQHRRVRRGEETPRNNCSWRCSSQSSPSLDELDSGLDVDALRDVSRRVQSAVRAPDTRGRAPRRDRDHPLSAAP